MKTIKSGPISAFGGANFVFDYLNKIKIDQPCTDCLPPMVNQSKYNWKDIFYSLKSVYLCGGDCIEDLQTNLKSHFLDNPFIKLAEPIQTCKTKRGAVTHQYCANTKLERLNIEILEGIGVFNPGILTVDYDNTIIFNEKQDSQMTYKRDYGYQPGVCTLNEGHILYIENRNGNSDAKSFQKETLTRVFDLLGSKKTNNFRADAASYQHEVISFLETKVDNFYIGCRNDYIEKYFPEVSHWEEMKDKDGPIEVGTIEIYPFERQSREKGLETKKYRLAVKRKLKNNRQIDLITQDAYEYRAIITNDFDQDTKSVVGFHNQRGNMERQFDILKNDFGWNNMPFSTLNKNLVFLYFTAIFRNLYSKIILYFSKRNKFLKPSFRMKKFIFRFITLPAKWIKQSRQFKLRIYTSKDYQT